MIKQTVERRISEKSSPNRSPGISPRRSLGQSQAQMSEEAKLHLGALKSCQDGGDPNQSFPETAFSDLQTERHHSIKKGPRVTPDVRASAVSARLVNYEKEPRKPNPSHHSGNKSKSISLASTVLMQKTPNIREENDIEVKPLKEKVMSAKKVQRITKPTPKFIQKNAT